MTMISIFSFYCGIVSLSILVFITIVLARGVRTMGFLEDFSPLVSLSPPLVSVIIPARNEKRHMERALQSVLSQEYPKLEFIVVDDRSTDGTAEILDRAAGMSPMLRVFHLKELPCGWLGKNHALAFGASKARGDLFLFTDADVMMQATTISRAVHCMTDGRLDHLTLSPALVMPSLALRVFVTAFYFFFSLYARPWKARDPESKAHIGIGAFNLIRKEAYLRIGTHQAIAMRPDDDMKLGKIVKRAGCSQDIFFGNNFLSVEWYASVRELIQGMMKNSFAGLEYRISMVVMATLGQLIIFVWPFFALFLTGGVTRWIYFTIVLILLLTLGYGARLCRANPWLALGFPLASGLLLYILWKSMIQTLRNGGIYWRDTFYPLRHLKANKV